MFNNTEIGYILENYVFDSSFNEEQDRWDDVFAGGFFTRRKRQAREKDDKDKPENLALMLSIGVQGFLIMNEDELPPGISLVSSCLNEILWESEEQNKLCSLLPKSLKEKIRNVLMMILKQTLSPKFFNLDFEGLMDAVDKADIEKLIEKIMGMAFAPITREDVSEIIDEVLNLWKKVVNKEKDAENKKTLKLVSDLVQAINDEPILDGIASIGSEVQGMMMRKESPAFKYGGRIGPAPDTQLICEIFALYKSQSKSQKVRCRK